MLDELTALRQRIERLEAAVGVQPLAETAAPAAPAAQAAASCVSPSSPPPPPLPIAAVPVWEAEVGPSAPKWPPAPSPAAQGRSIELFVGGRLAAWIGALVVVVGTAFFFRYAHVQGWLGAITPTWRCLFAAGFGALLLLAGEVAMRRVTRAAGVGLFAAGLGTLYLTVLVAYRHFNLLGEVGAFVLLAATALVGLAITVRSRALTVGILSLLAGYAAPMLVATRGSAPTTLPLYLTMLLGILLGLSRLMPRPFRTLRHVGLPVHAVLGFLWLFAADVPPAVGTIFAVAWWGMVFAEALLAAIAQQSRRANAAIVLLAAGWLATSLALGLQGSVTDSGWAGVIVAVVAIASVAFVSTDPRDGIEASWGAPLRSAPRSPRDLFAMATWLSAGVLLPTAAAIQFDDIGVTVAWLALGVAAVELGRRQRANAPVLLGGVLLLLTAGKVVTVDAVIGAAGGTLRLLLLDVSDLGLAVNGWSLLALAAATAIGAAAARVPTTRSQDDALGARLPARVVPRLAVALCAVATTLSLGAFEAMGTGAVVPALWLLVACILLLSRHREPQLRPLELGGAVLVASMVRWLAGDAWEAVVPGQASPWTNGELLLALPMAAVGVWFDRILRRTATGTAPLTTDRTSRPWSWRDLAPALPVVSVLGAVSIEVLRLVRDPGPFGATSSVRFMWWAILWSFGGLLMARLGRSRAHATTLALGTGMAAFAGASWILVACLVDRAAHGVAHVPAFLNLQAASGALVTVGLLLVARVAASRAPRLPTMAGLLALLALAAGLCVGSAEIERLVPSVDRIDRTVPFAASAVSLWWGVVGTSLVVVGFWRRVPVMRYAGLVLLGVTVAKFVVLDLRAADSIWRVVALVAVGLLLLAVGVLYVRFGAKVVQDGTAMAVEPNAGDAAGAGDAGSRVGDAAPEGLAER